MQITKAFQTVLYLATAVAAVPTPWSESLLEDINNLRASGLSEVSHRIPERFLLGPCISCPPLLLKDTSIVRH